MVIPDLDSYDIIETSSSGGKDSLAMKVIVARLLRERNLLHRGIVVHADLGRVEWPGTPALVETQARHVGLRFMKVKRPELCRDPRASGKGRSKIVDVWLPVQGMTEEEIWAECHASGAPIHPAYAAGLPRASCIFCIYAPEYALRIAGLAHPELLAEYVAVEGRIGHTFKRHLPIAKVAADLAAGVRPSGPVASWCM